MGTVKRILLIADGLADEGSAELQGLTPLAWASHDALDRLASQCCAMTKTILPAEIAGTERGVPRLLGVNPESLGCRASLEALALGINIQSFSWMARCNLCSLSGNQKAPVRAHDGGGVSDKEARKALEALQSDAALAKLMATWKGRLLAGQGFRHFLGGQTPGISIEEGPHDGLVRPLTEEPPQIWLDFVAQTSRVLTALPLNDARRRQGRPVLNGFWPWNGGLTTGSIKKHSEKTRGCLCISATPAVRGIALSLNMKAPILEGGTGDITTNWRNKAHMALKGNEPVAVIHIEAPDEASHRRSVRDKLAALDMVNQTAALLIAESPMALRLMVAIDHGSSVTTGRHLSSPVPWALWDSRWPDGSLRRFAEHDRPICDATTLWPLLLSDKRPESGLVASFHYHCDS